MKKQITSTKTKSVHQKKKKKWEVESKQQLIKNALRSNNNNNEKMNKELIEKKAERLNLKNGRWKN